ncbi:hypothetical protein GCM10029978_025770 [Actinoallomurus acanthiterrae]
MLAESTTWFHQATTSLGAVHRQLAVLSRAQQAGRAVPPERRTPRLRELLHRLAAQITMLRHEETGLQTALTVHDLYQSSSGQLAALNTALARLHQTSSPPAAGTDPQLTATLAQQQSALAQQVRAWSSGLRQALTLPLPVPAPTATRLAHRVITAATEPPPIRHALPLRPPVLQPAPLRKLRLLTHPHTPIVPTAPLKRRHLSAPLALPGHPQPEPATTSPQLPSAHQTPTAPPPVNRHIRRPLTGATPTKSATSLATHPKPAADTDADKCHTAPAHVKSTGDQHAAGTLTTRRRSGSVHGESADASTATPEHEKAGDTDDD